MISLKGFAIILKHLKISGDEYYGKYTGSPVDLIYDNREEAEKGHEEMVKKYS